MGHSDLFAALLHFYPLGNVTAKFQRNTMLSNGKKSINNNRTGVKFFI